MKTRKLAMIFASIVLAAIACVGFTACDDDDTQKAAHTHTPKAVGAISATCTTDGTEAYWTCEECGKKFADEACTQEITAPQTIAAHHTATKTEQEDATCTTDGTEAYWTCGVCSKKFADEACTQEITAPQTIAAHHTATKTEQEDATCTTDGTEAYWTCGVCSKKFADEACTQEIDEPQAIPAHHTATKTEQEDATCTTTGTEAYWTCGECGKMFSDEACTQGIEKPTVIPVKANLTQVAKGTNTGKKTSLPSGGELTLTNNAVYYECSECHNTFFANEHTDSKEITLTDSIQIAGQIVASRTISVAHYGGASLGTNKMPIVSRYAGILFKAETDGFYKISSSNAAYFGAINYYGKSETGTTPSIVYNGGWKKDAAQFVRFTFTPEAPNTVEGKYVYVKMDAGDVVSVSYGFNASPAIITLERIGAADLPVCQMHVASYDFSDFSIGGGTLTQKCAACLATIETVPYDKGIEVTTSAPASLAVEKAIVKTTQGTTSFSFTPDKAGSYNLTLGGLSAHAVTIGTPVKFDDTIAAMNMSGTWYYNSPFDNGTLNITSSGNTVNITVTIGDAQAGKALTFDVGVNGASASSPAYIVAETVVSNILIYGDNTVTVTEAYAMFIDEYEFIPTESKTYSLTVPAGVEVLMDDNDLITNSTERTVNFEGVAGTKIVFAFKHSVAGAITVTIGEAVSEVKIQLAPDAPLNQITIPAKKGNNTGVYTGGVLVVEVGEGVAAGKYTLTITLNGILTRSMVYFGKNIEPNYMDIYGPDNEYGLGGTAEAYINNMTATSKNSEYTTSLRGYAWTITLDLRAGDRLVFAHSNTMDGAVNISMAAA